MSTKGTVKARSGLLQELNEWQLGARCRWLVEQGFRDSEDWFSTSRPTQQRAQAVCERCAVRPECLDYAMRTNQGYGVWGGLTTAQRRVLRRKEAKG